MGGAGTPPDFESYVAARRAHLRRTAYLLCGDWDRAEDVVQDALTRLCVHWRRASQAESVDACVRRSLVNAYLNAFQPAVEGALWAPRRSRRAVPSPGRRCRSRTARPT